MPTYRYLTVDVLDGTDVQEIPQHDVYMDKSLSAPGSYAGSFALKSDVFKDNILLASTLPMSRAMLVQRDGVNIWSGPIMGRTYSSQDQTVQIQAQTFESVFERIIMDFDCIYEDQSQNYIVNDWLTQIASQFFGKTDFGFIPSLQTPTTATYRTILIPAYEYHFASELLAPMVGVADGIDYTVNLATTGDMPARTFRMMFAADTLDSLAHFDYPGTIAKYWVTENGTRIARRNVALGAGSGNNLLASAVTSPSLSAYPFWGAVESFPEIADFDMLNMKALTMSTLRRPPVYEPLFELRESAMFTGWNDLGKFITVEVRDPRFPSGQVFRQRLKGWSLSPGSKTSTETIQLTLDNSQ